MKDAIFPKTLGEEQCDRTCDQRRHYFPKRGVNVEERSGRTVRREQKNPERRGNSERVTEIG
jgi:hypothetical protein